MARDRATRLLSRRHGQHARSNPEKQIIDSVFRTHGDHGLETIFNSNCYGLQGQQDMPRVQRILSEFGQSLLPMTTAPRDGSTVLCYSERLGMIPARWDESPLPKWVASENRGFLDRAFRGWYDPAKFRPLREEELARLLVAYIDDMRDEKRQDVLKILDTPITAAVTNDNPAGPQNG